LSLNLLQRIVVAAIFGPLILFCAYLGGVPFLTILLIIAIGILYEMSQIFKATQTFPAALFTYFLAACILINAQYNFFSTAHLIVFAVALLSSAEVFRKHGSPIHNVGAGLLAILYAPLCFSTLLELRKSEPDGYFTMMIFIGVWAADTAAYFGGKYFGQKLIKTKFFERHSPNKTWEGFLSGLLACVGVTLGFGRAWLTTVSFLHLFMIGILLGVLSAIGDLIESMFKRESGLKDSSHLIPGHGGFFDRFDSLCIASPAVFLYVKYAL
jgi:phosphatidate cytidylyltransferase